MYLQHLKYSEWFLIPSWKGYNWQQQSTAEKFLEWLSYNHAWSWSLAAHPLHWSTQVLVTAITCFSTVRNGSTGSGVGNEGSGNTVDSGSGVGNESGRVGNGELYTVFTVCVTYFPNSSPVCMYSTLWYQCAWGILKIHKWTLVAFCFLHMPGLCWNT